MATTYTKMKPSYLLTIGDLYIVFIDDDGKVESSGYLMPEIKTITITPDASSNKIYASGKVRDIVNNVRGASIDLDLVTLPDEVRRRMLGQVQLGKVYADEALPKLPEFCMGYWSELADGSKKYYWHPRCKATITEESMSTLDDSDADPSETVTIEVMPTDENLWKITYYPTENDTLTLDAFYGAAPRTKAEMQAIGASAGA